MHFLQLKLKDFRVMSDSEKHEVEDPVELMLKRTGCIELHYKVQVSLWLQYSFYE